jgi:hypothetical protein
MVAIVTATKNKNRFQNLICETSCKSWRASSLCLCRHARQDRSTGESGVAEMHPRQSMPRKGAIGLPCEAFLPDDYCFFSGPQESAAKCYLVIRDASSWMRSRIKHFGTSLRGLVSDQADHSTPFVCWEHAKVRRTCRACIAGNAAGLRFRRNSQHAAYEKTTCARGHFFRAVFMAATRL